jgi:hypothetical protein
MHYLMHTVKHRELLGFTEEQERARIAYATLDNALTLVRRHQRNAPDMQAIRNEMRAETILLNAQKAVFQDF